MKSSKLSNLTSTSENNIIFDELLNKEQNSAATWEGGHVLILAGAGCGKTKTIIASTISY